jgi:hypothetical protein
MMNTHLLLYWCGISIVLLAGALGAVRAIRRYGLSGTTAVWFARVRNVFLALAGISLLIGLVAALVS